MSAAPADVVDVEAAAGRHARAVRRVLVPVAVSTAAVVGIVLVVHPEQLATAVRRLPAAAAAGALGLTIAYFGLQGLRWHVLLRQVSIRLRLRDSLLLNMAGQTVTAILPLGDLTRALFASEVGGGNFGGAAATVTVQELTFVSLLVISSAPALLALPHGGALVLVVLGGIVVALSVIAVPRLYRIARVAVTSLPVVCRLAPVLDAMHVSAGALLTQPAVWASAVIDLARVGAAVGAMFVLLQGLGISLGWWQAALVVAVAYVGGALSFLPGGIGANEASTVAVLAGLGVSPGPAAAAALIQRLMLSGTATVGGALAYASVHRRLHLHGLMVHPNDVAGLSPRPPAESRASSPGTPMPTG